MPNNKPSTLSLNQPTNRKHDRCQAPAQLQCPKCLSLNLPKAPYCSQECFKVCWLVGFLLCVVLCVMRMTIYRQASSSLCVLVKHLAAVQWLAPFAVPAAIYYLNNLLCCQTISVACRYQRCQLCSTQLNPTQPNLAWLAVGVAGSQVGAQAGVSSSITAVAVLHKARQGPVPCHAVI